MSTIRARHVIENGEQFVCDGCGKVWELGTRRDLNHVDTLTIELDCCGKNIQVKTGDEKLQSAIVERYGHTFVRNEDNTPICISCQQTSVAARNADEEESMNPELLLYTIGVLRDSPCEKRKTMKERVTSVLP